MTRRERRGLLIAALLVGFAIWLLTANASAANRIVRGEATTYGGAQYNGLLALPEGPGHRVRVCSSYSGEKVCVTKTSNDAGPDLARQRAGVIVDLDAPTFEHLCKCQWRIVGVIEVSVEYLSSEASGAESGNTPTARPTPRAPRPTLPPTDTGG